MSNANFLLEKDISNEKILEIFKSAYIPTETDNDGDVIVNIGGSYIFVSILEDKKLLRYISLFGFKEGFSNEEKALFVNKLNSNIIFNRFSLSEKNPRSLIIDYFLSYSEGIAVFNIVDAARLLSRITNEAIIAFDDNNMIE